MVKHLVLLVTVMLLVEISASPIKSNLSAVGMTYMPSENAVEIHEVEYLEDDGNQYIDTDLYCASTLKVEGKMQTYVKGGYQNYYYGVFGSWTSTLITHDWVGFKGSGNRRVVTLLNTLNTDIDFSVDFGNRIITRDGKTIFNGSATPLTPYSTETKCWLLKACGVNEHCLNGRIYYFKIWDSNILVRDFVTIRFKNNDKEWEGALLDRVSGRIFKNSGTGRFAIGPDVVEE